MTPPEPQPEQPALPPAPELHGPDVRELLDLGGDLSGVPAAELGERLRVLHRWRCQLDAEAARVLAAFDALGGYEVDNAVTAASWLRHELRLDATEAAGQVAAARVLRDLPLAEEAYAEGAVSARHVSVLARAGKRLGGQVLSHAEGVLVATAVRTRPADVQVVVDRVATAVEADESVEQAAERIHQSRWFAVTKGLDGWNLAGLLDPEQGRVVQAALAPFLAPQPEPDGSRDPRTPAQRRADALVDVAQLAMAVSGGTPAGSEERSDGEPVIAAQVVIAPAADVTLVLDLATLRGELEPGQPLTGTAALLGQAFPTAGLQHATCTAHVTPVLLGQTGVPLALGRTVRLASKKQLRALYARDGGCVAPDCDRRAVHAHHIVHWAEGGATDLDNLVLLCPRHHRLLHLGSWRLGPDPGRPGLFQWLRPDGGPPVPAMHAVDRGPGATTRLW
ncbi:HNH endonuclease [Motilibacter rhizosphaerae]|uniref:HNH endonuclease n=1 Tax=Motilibacter rhizosphaerae TaxID=598652 RepID=A0A4Q7NB52_9ACTN|nr:HNH endonuclease signature motif containing protein [Motilibacter rhizosphaerae]RZS80115.1 HNH endonuclease [Motilibacter rhizosphaerae]